MNIFNSVSFVDKLFFTKHLAVMVKSGITLSEALDTLAKQISSRYFKSIILSLLADVQNGQSLAKALKKHPHVFDNLYISLIDIGEEAGQLEANLDFLSKQLAKDYALQGKVRGALLYPGIVLAATTLIGGGIAFFILPQLVEFFSTFDIELPLTTKILLFVANIMKYYSLYIFLGIITIAAVIAGLLKIPSIHFAWERISLKLPIIGKLLLYTQLTRLTRNLGMLLKSGVIITSSLEITHQSLDNEVFKENLAHAETEVQKGKQLAQALESYRLHLIPPLVTRMIAVGEKTGKLDDTLLYLGDFYEEEIDTISKSLTTTLEPILLLVIGTVVGFIAIAIISPIYELTGSIQR